MHGPLILAFLFTGFLLCWPHPLLRPLLLGWLLAGIYLGRDLAIICHYAPFLTLACWGTCAVIVYKSLAIARLGVAHASLSLAISALIIAILLMRGFIASRSD